MELCVAKANMLRCVGCFLFPFAAMAAYAFKINSVGVHDVETYFSTITTGGTAFSALLFFGGCLAWVSITWPKARTALNCGRCAISLSKHRLWICGEGVERADIAKLEIVRRLFDFELRVSRVDGSVISKSITLLSPTPDAIIASLRKHGL